MTIKFPAFISTAVVALQVLIVSVNWWLVSRLLLLIATLSFVVWQHAGIDHDLGRWVLESFIPIEAASTVTIFLLLDIIRKRERSQRNT